MKVDGLGRLSKLAARGSCTKLHAAQAAEQLWQNNVRCRGLPTDTSTRTEGLQNTGWTQLISPTVVCCQRTSIVSR